MTARPIPPIGLERITTPTVHIAAPNPLPSPPGPPPPVPLPPPPAAFHSLSRPPSPYPTPGHQIPHPNFREEFTPTSRRGSGIGSFRAPVLQSTSNNEGADEEGRGQKSGEGDGVQKLDSTELERGVRWRGRCRCWKGRWCRYVTPFRAVVAVGCAVVFGVLFGIVIWCIEQ